MMLDLDHSQADVVREILEAQLKQLRFESAHADARAFREQLHQREQVVEAVLRKLPS